MGGTAVVGGLAGTLDDLVDQAVVLGLLGGEPAVAVSVGLDLLDRLAGVQGDQIEQDADRDRWFTADQAKDYGLVDQVITSAREAADDGRPARQKD